jgi:hypothetical protein
MPNTLEGALRSDPRSELLVLALYTRVSCDVFNMSTAWNLIYYGGMVCGDDYDGHHSSGVRAAVASLSANWGTSVSLTETAPGYHLYYAVKPTP